jgi:hypothetical protein
MQKGEFFVTGEVFLLDKGLLMGAIVLKTAFTHLTYGSVNSTGNKNPPVIATEGLFLLSFPSNI